MKNVNIFVKDSSGKVVRSIGPIPNDDQAMVKFNTIRSEYPTSTHQLVMRYAKEYTTRS